MTPRTLTRIAERLFKGSPEEQSFVDAILSGGGAVPTLLWMRGRNGAVIDAPAEWECRSFEHAPLAGALQERGVTVSIPSTEARPGASDLHQSGAFYCMDLSSIVLASVLTVVPQACAAGRILDLCAAPGGKGIFAHTLLGSRVIANEVIKKRLGMLISNLSRCQVPGGVVSHEVAALAERVGSAAGVVLLDTPCSGQSLLLKPVASSGKKRSEVSFGAFHPSIISMNVRRQRHLIVEAAKLVAPGGYLAYMTCSFSREENEGIVEWFLARHPDFGAVPVPALTGFTSHLSSQPCYRVWPWHDCGAGGFAAILRNNLAEDGVYDATQPVGEELLEPVQWRSHAVE